MLNIADLLILYSLVNGTKWPRTEQTRLEKFRGRAEITWILLITQIAAGYGVRGE